MFSASTLLTNLCQTYDAADNGPMFETNRVSTCVGAGRIDDVTRILTLRFVISDSVFCFMTFEHQYGSFLLGFVICIDLVCTCVGAETVDGVGCTLNLRFVLSDSVNRLLKS